MIMLEMRLLEKLAIEVNQLTSSTVSTQEEIKKLLLETNQQWQKEGESIQQQLSILSTSFTTLSERLESLQQQIQDVSLATSNANTSAALSAVLQQKIDTQETQLQLASTRLNDLQNQIQLIFNTVDTSMNARFQEWTANLTTFESTLSTSVQSQYSTISSAISQLKEEVYTLERSLLSTTTLLQNQFLELNSSQSESRTALAVELENMRLNFTASVGQLNEAVQASNMDFDESIEQLDSKQNSAVELMKGWVSQTFLNSSLKVQALNDRLEVLSHQFESTSQSNSAHRQALSDDLQAFKQQVQQVFTQIRQEYTSHMDDSLLAFNESVTNALSLNGKVASEEATLASAAVKSELLQKILKMEMDTMDKIGRVEKASVSGIKLLRLTTESDTKLIEGKMDYKVSGLQRDVKRWKDELEDKMDEMDSSLESRIEVTVSRLSFRKKLIQALAAVWVSVRSAVTRVTPRPVAGVVQRIHSRIGSIFASLTNKVTRFAKK
mmetsp:Transcript_31068/g.44634  ORF Transcript_31068/g.44634 Transcript_31068/m.44634 type:complete len:496 (-) Transcript_31068:102-1589(-)